MAAEHRARLFGSDVHLVAVGGPAGALAAALARLEDLEARWSRFRSGSDVCAVNVGAGERVGVCRETAELIGLAVEAWRRTGGLFDPTVLPQVEAAGYDRSFELLAAGPVRASLPPAPGRCGDVVVERSTVTVPAGTAVDLGGIGKGRAVDLCADLLAGLGVAGGCVNLGGDLRVWGPPPDGAAAWRIELSEAGEPAGLVTGALATSTVRRRRWEGGHHLIDPRTGRPADTDVVAATVVAAEAAEAEVWAKAAVLAGDGAADLLEVAGRPGLLVHADGAVRAVAGFEAYRW